MMRTRRSFLAASAMLMLTALMFVSLVGPSTAVAQTEGTNDVALKIQGYFGGTTASDPSVLGTITLADEQGKKQRSFGVTSCQTYDPVTQGMDIFQQASMKPAIIAYGRSKETDALFGAPDKAKLTITGIYWSLSGDLIVGSVKPAAAAAAAPAPAKAKAAK
jgi:hypothetical protein